ncbi:MAG: helix-turn-helix domain-containing protein [Pseudomonas sp.]|nr:MAG: helix-turn-helix domain-containing protein [Pseudomonas sp.]
MNINRTIREGRLRLGMTEHQFAAAVGVTRAAVQQWERPGGTAPRRRTQPRVAEVLGISVAELVSGVFNTRPGFLMRAEIPLVSAVEAGNYTIVDNFTPTREFQMVPVTVPIQRHTYALRVHGDSMMSEAGDSFPEGVLLVVEPEMQALPGDYVIALNEARETTFKQLIKDGGDLYLKPLNTRYPIKPLGTGRVIGVVREYSKRFR